MKKLFRFFAGLILLLLIVLLIKNIRLRQQWRDLNTAYEFRASNLYKEAMADSQGVPVVLNEHAETDFGPFELTEEMRIEFAREGRDSLFHMISRVFSDSRGNVYVIEVGSGHVKVFSKKGKFINSFGRKGSGPAEFLIGRLPFVLGDTLFIYDFGNQRCSLFKAPGEYLRSVRMPVNFQPRGFAVDTKGSFFVSGLDMKSKTVIHKYDAKGKRIMDFGGPVRFLREELLPQEYMILKSIGAGPIWIWQDTLYYSQINPYEIRKYATDGKLLMRVFRNNRFMLPAFWEKEIRGGETWYATHEPAQSTFIGIWDGFIINWVFIHPKFRDRIGFGSVCDVFSLDGKLVGSISMGESVTVTHMDQSGRLYGYWMNREGFEAVWVLKIAKHL